MGNRKNNRRKDSQREMFSVETELLDKIVLSGMAKDRVDAMDLLLALADTVLSFMDSDQNLYLINKEKTTTVTIHVK